MIKRIEEEEILKNVELIKNDEPKLNDEEWSRWEMEEGRTWRMEWEYHYTSSKIDSRSLQDQMEVGMAQFGVKIIKKGASGWYNSSYELTTRVNAVVTVFSLFWNELTRVKMCSQRF